MKLGMLSWKGTRHAVVFFMSILRRRTRITANKGIFETNSCHSNIANVLDRTPVCKVRVMVFPLMSRENSQCRICESLQCKRFFWMTRVQPRTNNLVRFASVILGTLPFVKLERLTFVDLVTLPFVNLVTLRFVKICS